MSILNPTEEELSLIAEVQKEVPLTQDAINICDVKTLCDWKYVLLGIAPKGFRNRYIDDNFKSLTGASQIIKKQEDLNKEADEFLKWSGHFMSDEKDSLKIEKLNEERIISNERNKLLKKIAPIVSSVVDFMFISDINKNYYPLIIAGAYVGNNPQNLAFKRSQTGFIPDPYGENVDLYAALASEVAIWLVSIKKAFPGTVLSLPDKFLEETKKYTIFADQEKKAEFYLNLLPEILKNKNDALLRLFLIVLRGKVTLENVPLPVARELYCRFLGIKIEKGGVKYNEKGIAQKGFGYQTINTALKPHFPPEQDKIYQEEREKRKILIDTLIGPITNCLESTIAQEILSLNI